MRTCVLIPAYNEEKTIGDVVRSINKDIADVLVVNDGSFDNTAEIAKDNGAIVLDYKDNRGKGKALQSGFGYALGNNYDGVVTMDADGQHAPDDIPGIINEAAATGAGVIVGNRMVNPTDMPLLRFITNISMSFILSVICRQNIPDSQCGFRFIKCDCLRGVRFISANYEIESEVLIRASRRGFRIRSFPIKSVYEGQVSLINPFVDTWRFVVMVFRVLCSHES